MIKEFTDRDLIWRRYIADLGENGEFYAQKIIVDKDDAFNRVQAEGFLYNSEEEKKAILVLTLSPDLDLESMTAGEIFKAAWDECQIEIL